MKGVRPPRCIYCGRYLRGFEYLRPYACGEHRQLVKVDPQYGDARRADLRLGRAPRGPFDMVEAE